jgi:hypothetical protein
MEAVGNFPDLASAQVARSLLRAADIEAEIPDEYFAAVNWQMSTAIKGVRVTVAPDDAEASRTLLREQMPGIEEGANEDDANEDDARELCPACASERVGAPGWKRRTKALAFIFPPLLLLYAAGALLLPDAVCSSCGHRWRR